MYGFPIAIEIVCAMCQPSYAMMKVFLAMRATLNLLCNFRLARICSYLKYLQLPKAAFHLLMTVFLYLYLSVYQLHVNSLYRDSFGSCLDIQCVKLDIVQMWAWVLLYMWSRMEEQESYVLVSYLGRAQYWILKPSKMEMCSYASFFLWKDLLGLQDENLMLFLLFYVSWEVLCSYVEHVFIFWKIKCEYFASCCWVNLCLYIAISKFWWTRI